MPPSAAQVPRSSSQTLSKLRAPSSDPDIDYLPLVVFQTPWWPGPVGLRRIAAAGAVERGDVLKRDQDMAVQLDVRHVLDHAVRRQRPLLVIPAEERDL